MKKTLPAWLLPGAVVLVAFALRVWAIGWGLPLKKAHIDESVVIFYTMRFFSGDLNPHIFFDYPTLFLYLLGGIYYAAFLAGKLFGLAPSLDQFVGMYLNGDASLFYILGRLASALAGTGTVWLVYLLGKRHFGKGLLAAIITAILPMLVLHSHYATVDIVSIFLLLTAFLPAGRYLAGEGRKYLYIAGLLFGVATAAKYYPGIFLVPLLAYAVCRERSIIPAAGTIVSCAAGFLAGCPYALIDHRAFLARFIDRFQLIVWPAGQGAAGASAHASFFHPVILLNNLNAALTFPLSLVLISGCIVLAAAPGPDRARYRWWLAFPVTYLLFIGTWNIGSPHYVLPAVPFIALAGVKGLSVLFNRKKWMAAALIGICCAAPLYKSVRTDMLLAKEDTRLTALRWMRENLPRGARILRLPHTPEFTRADPFLVRVDWEGKTSRVPAAGLSRAFDYIVISSFGGEPPSAWEASLLREYVPLMEWPRIPLAAFHHPRITIYGKKM